MKGIVVKDCQKDRVIGGNMILMLKIIVSFLFTVVLVSLGLTLFWIHQRKKKPGAVLKHRRWAWNSFWLILTALIATEVLTRLSGGLSARLLVFIHVPIAILFLALLVFLLRFTGFQNKRLHRGVAYLCLSSYLCTYGTGMALVWLL